jgi:hypothetical protein
MAKPCHLAFGISPGRALRRHDRSFERHLAVQIAQEFAQPDRLHRGQIGIKTTTGERCRLVERVCFDHPYETDVAGGIEPLARRHE